MASWFQFDVKPWRVLLAILAVSWLLADIRQGWFLLPVAGLSFFIYSPEQNLRRPRPRWIPYVTPSALVVLTITLNIWASEFPEKWYLLLIALLFFYQDNEIEEVLQKEKERYQQNQNEQNSEIKTSKINANLHSYLSGGIFFTVGIFIVLVAVGDLIFAAEQSKENESLGPNIFIAIIFGILPMAIGAHQIIRTIITKPIATVMHGDAIEELVSPPPPPPPLSSPTVEPISFEFQQIKALPPSQQHGGRITSTRNWLNNMPPKILMLWNFQRTTFQQYKTMLGCENWQQIGPVYMLSSQSGLPISRYFQFKMSGSLERAFITSNAAFEKLLNQVNDQPINHSIFSWAGGKRHAYPMHNWMCTSDTWKNSVHSLCEHVDVVILDARGFNAERVGLAWEITCLIDHVCTSKFVVLTDPTTILDELRGTFSKAWENMSIDSPNRIANEGIRVLHGIDTMHFETHKRFPEPFHRFEASQVAPLFPTKA